MSSATSLNRNERLVKAIKYQFQDIDDATAEFIGQSAYGFSRGFDFYMNTAQYTWIKGEKLTPWGEMALNRAGWLEAYIEKSPKYASSEALYRGMRDKNGLYDYFMNAKAGDIYVPKQLSSASSDKDVANDFARGKRSIFLEIQGPHRTATSLRHLSHYEGENEVVFSARSRFKILSKSIDGKGHLYVKIKTVAPDKEITKNLKQLKLNLVNNKADVADLAKIKKGALRI